MMVPSSLYRRWISVFAAGCVAAGALLLPASSSAAVAQRCTAYTIPVRIADPGPAAERLWGELCYPAGGQPRTVQLLVHGNTYDHRYWDFPVGHGYYSYVRAATAGGYATFDVDRVGSGRSSHPPSDRLDWTAGAVALHDVIGALRAGRLDGHAFDRVIWVGHSAGSFHAWIEIPRYHDVDGAILTSGGLDTSNLAHDRVWLADMYPAADDPKFANSGLDSGYFTTRPGMRADMFYYPATADPAVVSADEAAKDVFSTKPTASVPVPHQIRVPVLLVVGQKDFVMCDGVTKYDCTRPGTVRAFESAYYPPEARLQVATVPLTGHDLALSTTAPATDAVMLHWARATVPAR